MTRKGCYVRPLILWLAIAALGAGASDQLNVSTLAGSAPSPGTANGQGRNAQFYSPVGLVLDANGNVYVADSQNSVIRRINPNGFVSTVAGQMGVAGSGDGPAAFALFNSPWALAFDPWGNMYVSETVNCTIRKISPAGMVSTFAGATGIPGSADGKGGFAQFNSPEGLAIDGNGNVFVADTGNHTIRMINAAGVVGTLAGQAGSPGSADGPVSSATFNGPTGIALDANGNLFVADNGNHTIRKIARSGDVTTVAGAAGLPGSTDGAGFAARFHNPFGLALDANGNMYVSDYYSNIIRKIVPPGNVGTAAGIAYQTGYADGIGPQAHFAGPAGLALDASGNVYIADSQNNTIRKAVVVPAVANPTFAPWGRTFYGAQSVTISCATAGATIHYSTDGSTPTPASATYTDAIAVSETTTIKAYAVAAGLIDSDIISSTYTIAVYQPPITYNQTLGVIQNTPQTITLYGRDPEGRTLAFDLVSMPTQGTLSKFDAARGKVLYTPAQDYTGADSFTFTVNNGMSTSDPGTVSITVYSSGGGPGSYFSNTNIDSDGDGFPDEIEDALGTDPLDPNSTPFDGAAAGTPQALKLASLAIKLNFVPTASGRDSISLSGTLHVPAGFSAKNQNIVLDIGGVVKSFVLDSKGSALPSATDSFKLSIKTRKRVVPAQDARFVARFIKGAFSPMLQDEGLINISAKATKVTVPVIILFNNTLLRLDKARIYVARAGSSGRAR